MAAVSYERDEAGGWIGRLAIGLALTGLAAFESAQGKDQMFFAGLAGAAAIYLLRSAQDPMRQAVAAALDFVVISLFAFLCDPASPLWRAPDTAEQIIRFSSVGAGVAVALYGRVTRQFR